MKNEKFILNEENIKRAINMFLQNNKDITINYKKSDNANSNSFYLDFSCNGSISGLRISDHHTKLTRDGGGIRNLIVDEFTNYKIIMEKLGQVANNLRRKQKYERIDKLFEVISEQKV